MLLGTSFLLSELTLHYNEWYETIDHVGNRMWSVVKTSSTPITSCLVEQYNSLACYGWIFRTYEIALYCAVEWRWSKLEWWWKYERDVYLVLCQIQKVGRCYRTFGSMYIYEWIVAVQMILDNRAMIYDVFKLLNNGHCSCNRYWKSLWTLLALKHDPLQLCMVEKKAMVRLILDVWEKHKEQVWSCFSCCLKCWVTFIPAESWSEDEIELFHVRAVYIKALIV